MWIFICIHICVHKYLCIYIYIYIYIYTHTNTIGFIEMLTLCVLVTHKVWVFLNGIL